MPIVVVPGRCNTCNNYYYYYYHYTRMISRSSYRSVCIDCTTRSLIIISTLRAQSYENFFFFFFASRQYVLTECNEACRHRSMASVIIEAGFSANVEGGDGLEGLAPGNTCSSSDSSWALVRKPLQRPTAIEIPGQLDHGDSNDRIYS